MHVFFYTCARAWLSMPGSCWFDVDGPSIPIHRVPLRSIWWISLSSVSDSIPRNRVDATVLCWMRESDPRSFRPRLPPCTLRNPSPNLSILCGDRRLFASRWAPPPCIPSRNSTGILFRSSSFTGAFHRLGSVVLHVLRVVGCTRRPSRRPFLRNCSSRRTFAVSTCISIHLQDRRRHGGLLLGPVVRGSQAKWRNEVLRVHRQDGNHDTPRHVRLFGRELADAANVVDRTYD